MAHDLGQYNHSQTSASTTWNINHGLDSKAVAVDTFIDVGSPRVLTKAIPLSVVTTDLNNVTITWSANQSGEARIVAGGDE